MNRPITPNWQISLKDPTQKVEDADDIAQCVYIILSTVKGSDPLRPDFGSDIWKYIDKPMPQASPMMMFEAMEALRLFEPRLRVTNCRLQTVDIDKKQIVVEGVVIRSSAQVEIKVLL